MCELVRDSRLDTVLTIDPALDWAGLHAAMHALATARPIVTLAPERDDDFAVETMAL